jgi:hypothetical protein
MAQRGANIDSDHMLVDIKLRTRICRARNAKPQQLRCFAVDSLKNRVVALRYYEELESELKCVQAQLLSLDEKCKKLEEAIQRVAKNIIGYTRKHANIECGLTKSVTQRETRKRKPPESEPSKPKPEGPKMLTN